MSMSAKALEAALAMNNTIVAQAEKIAEMQRVIDGAVREGVYCKDGHWWNELCRLSTYTPNKACTRRAEVCAEKSF
jgi:hypothetical protein